MIDATLDAAERALSDGRGLKGTGFWKVVALLRKDRLLAARYAKRVASIDRRAFEAAVRLRVPAWLGTLLLSMGACVGVIGITFSQPLIFMAGFGALLLSTHSLTHWMVGRLVGIRFTHYFLGGPPPPRPGAKTDYETYLISTPLRRALMHGSGAVVTKVLPFALVPIAPRQWIFVLLVVVGVAQIVTDIAFSTKTSDWMKVIRELRSTALH